VLGRGGASGPGHRRVHLVASEALDLGVYEVLAEPKRREVSALAAPRDPVEAALSHALYFAAEAGRFDVVAQLAKELEARRLLRAGNVVALETIARQRGT
jgi:hypothetical protein